MNASSLVGSEPTGDFAFAAAVAAFGQKLRGDPLLADLSNAEIVQLSGRQNDYWRQEFIQLVKTSTSLQ